jgi:quinolinate synthase
MEFTEAMLDSIEAVKGVRNVNYWDGRCEQHFKLKQESLKTKKTTSENKTASSS